MTNPIRIPLGGTAVALIYSPESIGMNKWGVTYRSDLSQHGHDVATLAEALTLCAQWAKELED